MENHSKLGNSGSIGLHGALSLKMSTPMTETDYWAHFYYETNFSNFSNYFSGSAWYDSRQSCENFGFVIKVGLEVPFIHVGAHFQAKRTM